MSLPSRPSFRIPSLLASAVVTVAVVSGLAGCASAPPPHPPAPAPVTKPNPAVRLPIAQIDRGVQFVLPDAVLFEFGKAEFDQNASGPYLDRLAELLKTKTDKDVSVEGHTDNVGSAPANQALSERRARAVAQALVARGVAAARISERGFSFTRPVAPNDLDAGRRLNRRTEIIVLGEKIEKFTEGEPPGAFEDAVARIRDALEAAGSRAAPSSPPRQP